MEKGETNENVIMWEHPMEELIKRNWRESTKWWGEPFCSCKVEEL